MSLLTDSMRVACYCRLSQEDEKLGQSISIDTQRKILEDFCKEKELFVYDFYIDDGYTGTHFDRPDFKRMMDDIKAKKVNLVIVKDLSRFGREHLQVGWYIEEVFPKMGVRFLALHDDVDTSDTYRKQTDRIMTSVKNIFNEMWPAETSDKVRTALRAKAARGEFIGSQAPYGYIKSPKDKHVLIRDEETAPTVKWIFEMAAYSGYGYNKIARVLSARKIITPAANQAKRSGREYKRDPFDWNLATVDKMLHNDVYLGTVTSFKRVKQSYKSKKQITTSESEWTVNPNMHEAIIPLELWEAAHEKLSSHKRACPSGYVNIFRSVLRCADCGAAMGMGNCAGEDVFYVCNTYKKKSKERCKNHYIRYDVLSEYILSDIKAVLESYRSDKTAFREFLFEKLGKDNEVQSYEKDIEELKARNEKASQKMKMLYEDRLDGLITREQYIEQYELFKKEQQYCSQRLAEIERSMTGHKDENDVINSFIDVLEQHDQVDFLDSELLNRFISRIDVHQKEEQPDGTYHQEIDIKYRFIGGFES